MSEPIRNKKLDSLAGAPTPQNTPLNNAPISSHAANPQVSTIEEEDRAAAANLIAQNPQLVSMIQGKLGQLIGRSSGYIENLSPTIRKRITGLKGVQKEHSKLEAEFQEEVLQLEKKYFAKFTPLYEKRAKIVNGVEEPTQEDITAGTSEGDEIDDTKMDEDSSAEKKGIPEFWLSAMKNSTSLSDTITERDEAALQYLTDIRMEYLERPGFRLIFEFTENEFFTNKTITKTYYYQEENGYGGDFIYDHAEGDRIDWKQGKDLTVRIESKKQRNKNTKQTRIVKRTVPVESFFNFFTPPKPPGSEDGSEDEEGGEDLEERLELDYTLGEDIKEKLIPRAVDWFTGEALQFEEIDALDEGEFEDEDEDDEDLSDEDRDEDDEESEDEDDSGKPKQQETAECKQS